MQTSSKASHNPLSIISLRFNGHFPGGPGLAGTILEFTGAKGDKGGCDSCSYKTCKVPVKSSLPTNQHSVSFTGRMPFLSPNQQCQSTEGNLKPHSSNSNCSPRKTCDNPASSSRHGKKYTSWTTGNGMFDLNEKTTIKQWTTLRTDYICPKHVAHIFYGCLHLTVLLTGNLDKTFLLAAEQNDVACCPQ